MNLLLAETAATPRQNNLVLTLVYVVLFGAMIYFLMIRPQKKQAKEAKEMMESLKVGDKIVTRGGIVGRIIHIDEDEVTIETSVEKTQMVFLKEAIGQVRTSATE